MDESGDHGLTAPNSEFPVFLLCGILISEKDYEVYRSQINRLKAEIWKNKTVIFHSRDIRKCEKEFQVLFDLQLKGKFYKELNNIIAKNNYTIFASAIKKDSYIKKYGRLSKDVYELALSFIIERVVFCLDDSPDRCEHLEIIIEKRGKKEDKKLAEHFQRLLSRGTGYVNSERLKKHGLHINFKSKKENINGLQLADLIAYPIARFVLEPQRANPAYEVFSGKFYTKKNRRYGLKIFP